MDHPDLNATKRRRVVEEDTGSYSAEYQHQSQHHHYIDAKTAKPDLVPPPSTSGTSSEDFQFTAFQNPPTMTGFSPIRFEDFLNEPTGETPRPEESEEPGPNTKEHKAEEDVSVRERHNSIGKRYRNKLNEQFETLEALLSQQQQNPEEEDDQNTTVRRDMDPSSSSSGQVKKRRRGRSVNKASLLEMAKVRIKTLTEQREMLIAEVEQLEKELAEEAAKQQQASGSHHE